MKKFNQLSRDEMKNVKGGMPPPGCFGPCWNQLGAEGVCSNGTLNNNTCPCRINGQWDGVTLCTTS